MLRVGTKIKLTFSIKALYLVVMFQCISVVI